MPIILDSNVKIPGNWTEFLRDSKNKAELFKFLGDNPVDTQSIPGDLYISSADGKTVKHWGTRKKYGRKVLQRGSRQSTGTTYWSPDLLRGTYVLRHVRSFVRSSVRSFGFFSATIHSISLKFCMKL